MISALVATVGERALADRAAGPLVQHWGDFVLAEAFIDVYAASGDERYLRGAREIVDSYIERGADYGAIVWQWAGIGLPALRLHSLTGSEAYKTFGMANVERLLHATPRTRDGGITTGGRRAQLWVDVLHFACPAFAEAALLTGDESFFAAATEQINVYLAHLFDDTRRLSYHVWDEEMDSTYPCFWSRGNGWLLLALVEVLARLPRAHVDHAPLTSVLGRHARAVRALQDPSGHWHTVIDRPDSYLETSGAAIFGLAIMRGARAGLVERSAIESAVRAWSALRDKVDQHGRVFDVSAGTPPGDFDHYQRIPRGVEPYGTGLFLQLGVEMSSL